MAQIGPITQNIINCISRELKKESTKEKISTKIIDPIVSEIHSKLMLYYYGAILFVVTVFILIVLITWKVFRIEKLLNNN